MKVCVERAGVGLTWTFTFAPTGRDREDGAGKGGEIGDWRDRDGKFENNVVGSGERESSKPMVGALYCNLQ